MAQRRGISNVVATIILIAVAIALAVAVAIWVFGIFKGSAHATTLNAISEDLYVTNGGNYLVLYVSNPGGTTQNIVSVTLSGASCNFQGASTSSPVSSGSVASSLLSSTISGVTAESNNEVVIAGGVMAYLVYTCGSPGSFTPGIQYSGTIYLSTGTNIPFTVTAQS
jgi:flagellin-like protein